MAYVGIGLRLVATIIDWVVLFVIMYVVALATGNVGEAGFEMQGTPALLGFVLWFLYYVAMEATTGATLGKMAVGIRVVRADGASPIGWGPSIIRNVLRIVDGLFVYLIGAVLVMTSPTKQRLGDRVAGTVVVKRGSAPVATG
jgi:uncharacterized RDD family membrane protein YckC